MVTKKSIKSHSRVALSHPEAIQIRVRPRFFDQVGRETMYASSENKHFSLNLVVVRPTKIMNKADKNWAQFLADKVS